MQRFIVIFIIIVLLFPFATEAYAEDTGQTGPVQTPLYTKYQQNDNCAFGKLCRGTANLLMGWFEVPKAMTDIGDEYGKFSGFTWGILVGLFKTGVRMLAGVYEVATFPIPLPPDYKPILTDPEYFPE